MHLKKKAIKVIDDTSLDAPSLSGEALRLKAFKNWITEAEETPPLSSKEARSQYANKKKQLYKFFK